jgi:hypothetical protein
MDIETLMQKLYSKHKDNTPFLFLENINLQHHIYDTTIPSRIDSVLPDLSSYNFVKHNKVDLCTVENIETFFEEFFDYGVTLEGDEREMFLSQSAKSLFRFFGPSKMEEAFEKVGEFGCDFHVSNAQFDCDEMMKKHGAWVYTHDFNSTYCDTNIVFVFAVCKLHDNEYSWDQSGSCFDWCPLFIGGGMYDSQELLYNINPDSPLYHRVMTRIKTQDTCFLHLLDCTLEQCCRLLECLYDVIDEEEAKTGDRPYPMVAMTNVFLNKHYKKA